MNGFMTIAVYRAEVHGAPDDLLDIRVRYFAGKSPAEIEAFLRAEPFHRYLNGDGETVVWSFVKLLSVEPFQAPEDGAEVVGFIAASHEFARWTRPDAS